MHWKSLASLDGSFCGPVALAGPARCYRAGSSTSIHRLGRLLSSLPRGSHEPLSVGILKEAAVVTSTSVSRLWALLLIVLLLPVSAVAETSDWPRFRGPNGSGVADVAGLPVDLSPGAAQWQREVPFGRSSPIVVGGLVFLTGLDGDDLVTFALDAASGELEWKRAVPRQRVDEVSSQSGPAVATPVSDGSSVYSFFPEFGLVSYSHDGTERWRHELPPFRSYYGLASSPVLENGVLVLLCDQVSKPYILGVDAATGKTRWKQDREVRAESWTTPVVHRPGTPEARVITFGTFITEAYDPRTGESVWRLPGVGPTPVASPVLAGDMVYVVAPDGVETFSPPSVASFRELDGDGDGRLTKQEIQPSPWASAYEWFDLDGDGAAALSEIEEQLEIMASREFGLVAIDLAQPGGPRVVWKQERTLPYVASPLVYDGVLYLVKDGGILTSYDPASGEVLKRGRIEGAVEPFSPSPVAADGKLILTSDVGTVAVVRAGAQWETLAVSELDEAVFATPAIADGRIFVRTRSKLLAFRASGAADAVPENR